MKRDLVAWRISKLEQGKDSLVFTFQDVTPLSPQMLLRYLDHNNGKKNRPLAKITPDSRLVLNCRLSSPEDIFDTITAALNEFTNLVNSAA